MCVCYFFSYVCVVYFFCSQFSVFVEPKVIDVISQTCDGDARCALNCLQNLLDAKCGTSASNVTIVSEKEARESLLRSHVQYDRIGMGAS